MSAVTEGVCVGIDLGTSSSLVAAMDGPEPVVLPNHDGGRSLPSYVAFASDGSVLVGASAKRQAVVNPEHTFSSVKRHLGSGDRDGDQATEEVCSHILRRLREDAELRLCAPVREAVVAVPTSYTDRQRRAIVRAAETAGIRIRGLVNEPTAAALAYGLGRDLTNQSVLVVDLGGGTLDVSLLAIDGGHFTVRCTGGDPRLGGDDWDARIVERLLRHVAEHESLDLRHDRQALQRLTTAAEEAKVELSSAASTQVMLPYLAVGPAGPIHLDVRLTRAEVDSITIDLRERCGSVCRDVLAGAGVGAGEVDRVILVGGASRVPAVIDEVAEVTGRVPVRPVDPDEAVALGAAVYASILSGQAPGLSLSDVVPATLGIEVRGGRSSVLIPKHTPLPASVTRMFTTGGEDQTAARIRVLQGDSTLSLGNVVLDTFVLDGIQAAGRGQARISVTYEIDRDGLLHVSARDPITGSHRAIRVRAGAQAHLRPCSTGTGATRPRSWSERLPEVPR